MYKIVILATISIFAQAETNSSKDNNSTLSQEKDMNITSKKEKINKQLKAQMEKEKKFAKEKTFYQGKDYNLSEHEVDPESLNAIPLIEPDYDFNMDDVYD